MKIKKIAQSIGVLGKILNSKSTSTENTYSCDYINNLNNYSTEEQIVGTWIDGRPIYRKVVDCGYLLNSNSKTIAHKISNLDNFTLVTGVAYDDDKNTMLLPHASSTYQNIVAISVNSTIVTIATGMDRTTYRAYVTLEYTKTTDTASVSTTSLEETE